LSSAHDGPHRSTTLLDEIYGEPDLEGHGETPIEGHEHQ
jgi:hypothetical protein